MAVRTTVDIPEPLHDLLRERAEQSGTSIRSLVVQAIEQAFQKQAKRKRITGPLVNGRGQLGPAFPTDENPHDLILS